MLFNLSLLKKNTIFIILAAGLLKFCILIRDILLINHFGVNKNIDIYIYSLMIPAFFSGIIALSFNYFFIPSYLKIKTDYGQQSAAEYASMILLQGAALIGLIFFLCGWVLPLGLIKWNKFFFITPEQYVFFYQLSKWASVFFLFFTLSLFFASLLQAEHRYLLSYYPQLFTPCLSIIFILLSPGTLKILFAIIGGAIGAVISCAIFYLYCRRNNIVLGFHNKISKRPWRVEHGQFFILFFSFVLSSFVAIIDQQTASMFGEGKLTVLSYGIRIPDGITDLFCSALGIATFSHFSQWYADGQKMNLIEAAQKVIAITTIFIGSFCIFISLYAIPITSIIFEHGAFSRESTLAVSRVLMFSTSTIYFAIIATVGAKIISATRRNQFFLIQSLVLSIFKIFSNLILIKLFDIIGIVVATILMQILNCSLIYSHLYQKKMHIFQKRFLVKLVRSFLTLGIVGAALLFVKHIAFFSSSIITVGVGLLALSGLLLLFLLVNRKYQIISFTQT